MLIKRAFEALFLASLFNFSKSQQDKNGYYQMPSYVAVCVCRENSKLYGTYNSYYIIIKFTRIYVFNFVKPYI